MKKEENVNNIKIKEREEENIEEGENYENQQDEDIEYEEGQEEINEDNENEIYDNNDEQENTQEEEYYQDKEEENLGDEEEEGEGEGEIEQDEKGTQVEQNEQVTQVDQGTQMSQVFPIEQEEHIKEGGQNDEKDNQSSCLKIIPQITTETISNIKKKQFQHKQNNNKDKIPSANYHEKLEVIKEIQNEFPSSRKSDKSNCQFFSSHNNIKKNNQNENQKIYHYQKISFPDIIIESPKNIRKNQMMPIYNIYSPKERKIIFSPSQNYSFNTTDINRPYSYQNQDYIIDQRTFDRYERRNVFTPQNHIQTFNINGLIYYTRCPNCNYVLNNIPNNFQFRQEFPNNYININDEFDRNNYIPNNSKYNNYNKVSPIVHNNSRRHIKTEPSLNQFERDEKLLKEKKDLEERIIKERKEREEKKLKEKKEREEKKLKERKEMEERIKKQREEREKKIKEEREKREKLKKERKEQQYRETQKILERKEKERQERLQKEKKILQKHKSQIIQKAPMEPKKEYRASTHNMPKSQQINYNSYKYNKLNISTQNTNNNLSVPKNYYINDKGVVAITPPNKVTTTIVRVSSKPDYFIYRQNNYGRTKNMGFYQSQKYDQKVYTHPIKK